MELPEQHVQGAPDNADSEVPDPKRAIINLNADQNTRVVWFISIGFLRLLDLFGLNRGDYDDLTFGGRVASLCYTAHNILRQEVNAKGNLSAHRDKEDNLSCSTSGVSKKVADICQIVSDSASTAGLHYSRPAPDEKNHWYGTANPPLAFKERLAEMRTGCSVMTARKSEGESAETKPHSARKEEAKLDGDRTGEHTTDSSDPRQIPTPI